MLSFERSAPQKPCTSVALGGLDASQQIVDIDVRPSTGDVYALVRTADQGTAYLLDPAGLARNPVTLDRPLVGENLGIDFDPTGSEPLRVVSDAGRELRVDVATGTVSELTFAPAGDVAFPTNACSNAVPGATSSRQYLAGAASGHLRILDTATNRMFESDPEVIGTVAAVTGFDVDGRDNTAIVGIETADAAATTLYELDPATGIISKTLGRVGAGERLRGLALRTRSVRAFGLVAPNTRGQGLVISMAFEPTAQHALRIVGTAGIANDVNLRVNPQTGAVITDEPLVLPALVATATAFTTGPASAGQSRWYVFDQTGQLFTVDPSLRAARPVGGALQAPSPTGVFGFDIAGGDDGLVFAALQRPHEAFSRLYRIELATGRGTEVGHGIATTPLRGLALRVE